MKRYNYIPKNKIIKLPKVRAVITEGLKTKNMHLAGMKIKIIFILIDIIESLTVDVESLLTEINFYKFDIKGKIGSLKKLFTDFRIFFNILLKDYPVQIIEFGYTADKVKDIVTDILSDEYKAFVIWSVEDFKWQAEQLKGENWRNFYDESKFEAALDSMIKNHDAEYGITWSSVNFYLNEMCINEDNRF